MYEQIPDAALDAARYWAKIPKPRPTHNSNNDATMRRHGFRRVGEAAQNYNPERLDGQYE